MPKRKRLPTPSLPSIQLSSDQVQVTFGKMSDNKGKDEIPKEIKDMIKNQADMLAQIKEMNSKLDKLASAVEKNSSSNSGSGGGYQTDGSLWQDGPYTYEGKQSLAIVDTAYNKAKELKDRGDDRSFAMIFGQLSMDLRRGL